MSDHALDQAAAALREVYAKQPLTPELSKMVLKAIQEAEHVLFNSLSNRWWIEDIQGVREDLTDEQAREVLAKVDQDMDCNIGINWLAIKTAAESLFPLPEEAADNA